MPSVDTRKAKAQRGALTSLESRSWLVAGWYHSLGLCSIHQGTRACWFATVL